ncbi:hypothetical protein OIDMADRAFT_138881, partial [Oidiodendron maius Zn]
SPDWCHQIGALQAGGFGVMAPGLLGYGYSDSPSAREAYSLKNMSNHTAEILSKLCIAKVVGVGHDDWYVKLLLS